MWASNARYTEYLAFSSPDVYDRFKHKYNVDYVVSPDLTLDVGEYESYSKHYLSTTFTFSYALSFGVITVHVISVF